jgi:hypothetical protein
LKINNVLFLYYFEMYICQLKGQQDRFLPVATSGFSLITSADEQMFAGFWLVVLPGDGKA